MKYKHMRSVVLTCFILSIVQLPVQAQETQYTRPSWWFGEAIGANFNFYSGSIQKLNANLTAPVAFHKGFGVGLFLAPLVEYRRPDSKWGIMLQAGFDSRRGKFEQQFSPCNCPRDLSTKLGYLTIEPGLRFNPFQSGFYLYGGPRVALNMSKSFTYKEGPNPDYPNQVTNSDVNADLGDVKKTLISMQIGVGYDFPISSQSKRMQYLLSPFISYQPYFGQSPRSIETWSVSTLRVGLALKFGRGRAAGNEKDAVTGPGNGAAGSVVRFSVNAPKNIPGERKVREVFPVRNYVFFDLSSTAIPDRYVLLKKDQVKDFKEDQVYLYTPKNLSGRSKRQMIVYYNILNILGDRMGKNPSVTITLVGSSEKGIDDGLAMAGSIRKYLVDIFGINISRIAVQGRDKPKIPSEKPGSTSDIELLKEGDRRVSIESSSPVLLMEFQSGPTAPLKPVEIISGQEAPPESYISFNNAGSKAAFSSWSMEIKDEKGKSQNFGPFTEEKVSIPGKSILGNKPEGDYKVIMTGKQFNGQKVKKDTTVHMVLWTPSKDEEVMRFSILYEFNESKAIAIYEKYLTDIIIPKIPKSGKVVIHGYSDIIGDADHNQQLSVARANDVRSIIENGLIKAGRSDVKFEVYGSGEDEKLSQFENKFPEERFYNRTVIIDIVPVK